jgi:hypothetical protein
MNYTQTWLEDPASIRGILVEATVLDIAGTYGTAGTEVVIYLSNVGYTSSDATVTYLPYLTGNIQTTESLSIDNTLSMSFGDIQINNLNGELDSWLDSTKFIWVNRPIKVYLGDPRWNLLNLAAIQNTATGGFEKVFDGIIGDIDSSSREYLNIKVRDKLEKLNVPATDSTVGTLGTYGTWVNGQTNQDSIIPLIFGEVFNISPMLIDPSQLEYYINNGPTELVIEIRDNGAPIYTDASIYGNNQDTRPQGVTVDLTTGKFKLLKAPIGTITASLQGIKKSINLDTGALVTGTYINNIANLVALLVTQYGPSATRLTTSDVDWANFKAFSINANNIHPTGTAVTDRSNILIVCQNMLASANAQLFMSRKGLLQILQLGIYTSDPVVTITDNNILNHTLQISNRTEVVAATKIGYCKNYTQQTGLALSLPAAHTTMFNEEWSTSSITDTAVQSTYKLDVSPVQKDTNLINATGATALATRLNNYFKVPRTVYSFVGTSTLLSLKLGQQVTLVHNRFGLESGKTGQVISLSPNWQAGTINVEVII